MPHAPFELRVQNVHILQHMGKIDLHICSIYVTFVIAFELTIDFGILICTFATVLVIFILRLITLG